MKNTPSEPLSDAEAERLSAFLESAGATMNLEQLDGFFFALISGPETVMMSDYWPVVLGYDPEEKASFESLEQAQQIMHLLQKHWNAIATTLYADEFYQPIMFEDDDDPTPGRDWAIGYMKGVDMRRSSWSELFSDDEQMAWILPMLAFSHENDPDPELRYESPSAEKREQFLNLMVAGAINIYQYFRDRRAMPVPLTPVRAAPTQGRNERCACGSGKKFKNCCMRSVH